jgi:hypothetical protein
LVHGARNDDEDDPKKYFLEKYQYGYQKNAEFYADFKFVDAGFQKCP